jgi:DNA-binding FadR family transcriptional regulator
MRQRNEDHRQLLEAMRSGDSEKAGRISEAHVMQSKERFIDSVGATIDPIGGVFSKKADD